MVQVAFDGLADVVAGCAGVGSGSRAGVRGRVGWVSVRWPGAVVGRRFRNPRRTRAGVSRPGGAGRSQGRRRSAASGRARRSWVCAAMISQVQRSAASGVRIFGAVQPRVCLNSRKVCSRSKRRRNACQQRSTSAGGGAGDRGPQPDRLRVAVAGQVVDLQPDQGALDDRQLAVVVDPAAAAGQPGVDPVPARRDRGAVAGGVGGGGRCHDLTLSSAAGRGRRRQRRTTPGRVVRSATGWPGRGGDLGGSRWGPSMLAVSADLIWTVNDFRKFPGSLVAAQDPFRYAERRHTGCPQAVSSRWRSTCSSADRLDWGVEI